MMCNKGMVCFTGKCGCMKDVGLLFLRIGVGIPFILHGIAKLTDIAGTTGFFASIGLSSIFVYLVGFGELIAGIMILLGLWSAIGGWIVSITMAGAYILVKHKMSFFGGYELDMVFFFAGLALAMMGSGRYSIKKDACCKECTTGNGQIDPNMCSHMNCACGDCGKCK